MVLSAELAVGDDAVDAAADSARSVPGTQIAARRAASAGGARLFPLGVRMVPVVLLPVGLQTAGLHIAGAAALCIDPRHVCHTWAALAALDARGERARPSVSPSLDARHTRRR